MGKIGDVITTEVPTTSTAQPGGMQQILDLLNEFKTRLTSKVQMSSLDIADADLDMSGNRILRSGMFQLEEVESLPTSPLGSFVRYAGNAYYIDSSGAVQLTSGGAVNVASAGGIVGDYGIDNRLVSYDDATEEYRFYDRQDLTEYAKAVVQSVKLSQDGGAGKYVELKPNAAPSASYVARMPAALPGANASLLSLNAAGQIERAETESVLAAAPLASTFPGVKHVDRPKNYTPAGLYYRVTAGAWTEGSTGQMSRSGAGPSTIEFLLDPPENGRRAKKVRVYAKRTTAPSGNVTVTLARLDQDGAVTNLGSQTLLVDSATGAATFTVSSSDTVGAFYKYRVTISDAQTSSSANLSVNGIELTWDYV